MSILAKDHSDPGTYLESVGERILGEVLNRLPKAGSRPYLDLLMRDYPERGGKRFRPALILLCCEMMGGDPEDAVVSATCQWKRHLPNIRHLLQPSRQSTMLLQVKAWRPKTRS